MLDEVIKNTNDFIQHVPKSQRKRLGQFFTTSKTAAFMANMINVDLTKPLLHILDAGAGTGILSAALLDRIMAAGYAGKIVLTCYETDAQVLPVLKTTLELAKQNYGIRYELRGENYLTGQFFGVDSLITEDSEKFDYIIGNPPYLKISKDALEAKCMPAVCHGAPNLYFLFFAMGIYNLKPGQEMVYIIPRSWTSGAYFKKFRDYLFDNCVITDIHLFGCRDKVFGNENVLQETMIVKVKKTTVRPSAITISTSSTSDFIDIKRFEAPYGTIVANNKIVYLITDTNELKVLERINSLPCTLPSLHLKMQTGLIVDFRTRESLRDRMEEGAFPLLYAAHIREGRVMWPIGKEGEVIKTERRSFLQENGDFLMVKRFTSKEEKRRLQCGIYLKQRYKEFRYISTQNKINFVKCDSPCITYGLYVLLNSSLYDAYYRIMNGSTQVNSTEINLVPIPERKVIEAMGQELMQNDLSEESCNKIVDRWIR